MRKPSIVMAAFNKGAVPTIACFNKATVGLGVDFDQLIATLQTFLDESFVPVWGTPAKLVKATRPLPGAWTLVFLDDADSPGALGYHDLTKDGLPLSKIFVKTTLEIGDKVSVTACHELAEMLVDPAINLWSDGPNGTLYAYEMCDAVEEEEFSIDGIAMSDFVYPAYFELFRKSNSAQFDYLKRVTKPFQILKGGYSLVRSGRKVVQKFGSKAKERRFQKEDRTQHRTQYRIAMLKEKPLQTAKLRAAPPQRL
ncbi:MAG: hypothetical protein ACREC9_03120 [Methylocella sp.]